MTITTHDLTANGKNYILEWTHSEEGTGYIAITEACDNPDADESTENCEHETYDFKEVL